ncbi:MAG: hypothetical protein WDA03_03320 [Trueperaceae bacterium]|jgi:hypothetical protein
MIDDRRGTAPDDADEPLEREDLLNPEQLDEELDEGLDDSFPASDPPSIISPKRPREK